MWRENGEEVEMGEEAITEAKTSVAWLCELHSVLLQEQYTLCHTVLAEYVDSLETYANFKDLVWCLEAYEFDQLKTFTVASLLHMLF